MRRRVAYGGTAMNCNQFLTIITVMFASAALLPVPGNAAVAKRAHAANQSSPDEQNPHVAKSTKKERRERHARLERSDKAKRSRDKEKARRIAAYTLFRDPQFKLEGAITDKRHFDAITRNNAPNAGALPRTTQAMLAARTINTGIPQNAFRAGQQDNAGLDFNCHEKILSPSIANRETSACYQYELGKAWKAQTYVSRQRTEGNWGGGLSLGFAY